MISRGIIIAGIVGLFLGVAQPVLGQKSKVKAGRKKEAPKGKSGKDKLKAKRNSIPDSLKTVNVDTSVAKDLPAMVQNVKMDSILVDTAPPAPRYYTAVKEAQLVAMENRTAGMRNRLAFAESDFASRKEMAERGQPAAPTPEEIARAEARIEAARTYLEDAEARLATVRAKLTELGKIGVKSPASSGGAPGEADIDQEEDDDGEFAQPGAGKGAVKGDRKPIISKGKKGGKGKLKRNRKSPTPEPSEEEGGDN